ncbi:MAG: DNRLRE domain-containing protein [Candidatus Competibacteraceae bacterium]
MKSSLLYKPYKWYGNWYGLILCLLIGGGLLAGAESYGQQGGDEPITVTGTLEIIISENADTGNERTDYFLQVDNGPTYQLLFGTAPTEPLTTGQRAVVTGLLQGGTLQVTDLDPDPNPHIPTVGDRHAVVLMVDLQDAKASSRYSLSQIATLMYTGTRSVNDLYRKASLDQLGFVADTDNNGQPDVFGPFTVNDYASQSCNYVGWAQAAEAAATAAGINLSLYEHKVFVLPYKGELPLCDWSGIANVGCGNKCRAWIAEGDSAMVYAHELGHNLNMGHAGTDSDNDGIIDNPYNDASDPMGSSRSWHLFSAPHVDQMEWYGLYPGSVVTVTQNGTYDIRRLDAGPIEVPPLAPRILKLQRPNGQGYTYLSYRQPLGYDDSLWPMYTQGVNLHWYQGNDSSNTAFITSLTDGATFTDNTGGGITQITQVSHSSDYVTVNISLCTSAPPKVETQTPSKTVLPGSGAFFTFIVTNQDSPGCPATTFMMTYLSYPTGTLTSNYLTLGGGASGSVTLVMPANSGLPSDRYLLEVQANDMDAVPPVHLGGVKGSATLIVDGIAPTAPTAVKSAFDAQGRVALTWNAASDSLSGVQTYIVYRNSVEIGRVSGLSYVDASPPAGTNSYLIAAMDGAGNAAFSALPVTTTWPSPPTVTITAPAGGAAFTTDQSITFTGAATSLLDGNLSARLRWTSNLDGVIGNGSSFSRTLSAGFHTITAQATDNQNITGAATLTLNVIRPTTLTLNSIGSEDGWVLESAANSGIGGSIRSSDTSSKALLFGDSSKKQQYKSIVSFDTSALPDNATITSATLRVQRGTSSGNNPFNFPSSLLADIRTGGFNGKTTLETADFQAPADATGVTSLSNATVNGAWSEGALNAQGLAAVNKVGRTQFRLYFNVKSNNDGVTDYLGGYGGAYGTATFRPQLVLNYIVNTPPAVTITTPANETQVAPGTTITFSGTAGDAEDGDLTSQLVWTSDRDGVIGKGGAVTTSTLSVGIHTITATVTDSFGIRATASITLINSTNQRPSVTISSPANGASFIAGDVITFSGTATDVEDGNLTGNLSWTSNIDGNIGSGGVFTRTLSAGTHTIQAQVTDSFGFVVKPTVTITVAPPPSMTLTSIGTEDGWVLESSETSNLGGTIKASDSTSVGLMLGDNNKKYQYKSILSFDTSTLPANATILSATLRLQRGTLSGTNPFTTHGSLLADIRTGGFNGNNALETADFQAAASATGVAILSNAASNGAWSEGTLNASGLVAINRAGRTQFRLYFTLDDDNDSTGDYLGYYAGEYGTAASRPQLVVTYR